MVFGEETKLEIEVYNYGPELASGTIILTGVTNRGALYEFTADFTDLAVGDNFDGEWYWTAPADKPTKVHWTAVVIADDDTDASNNTIETGTKIKRN